MGLPGHAGAAGEATRRAYNEYIRNYIDGGVGHIKILKLRAEDLDRWYADLAKRGLGPATIRKAHNIVRGR